jgi:guanylate kinase
MERAKATKLAHVKYFHNHIIKRLKLRTQDFEEKLGSKLSSLQNELEFKNKLIDGSATSSDFEKTLETLNANNQKLLQKKDKTIQTLYKDLDELKGKLNDNV